MNNSVQFTLRIIGNVTQLLALGLILLATLVELSLTLFAYTDGPSQYFKHNWGDIQTGMLGVTVIYVIEMFVFLKLFGAASQLKSGTLRSRTGLICAHSLLGLSLIPYISYQSGTLILASVCLGLVYVGFALGTLCLVQ